MPVADFIAHQIDRHNGAEPASVSFRDSPIPIDDHASQLLNELKQVFATRTSKRYGHFDAARSDNPLPGWLRDLLKQQLPFAGFSRRLAEHFVTLLDAVEVPFAGHLLFWQENSADAQWLYLLHLQHQTGLVINNRMEITETAYADLSHAGFCARINLTQWADQLSEQYLTVSRNRGDRFLQDIFLSWIGFSDTVNVSADTNEFINIVEAYTRELPADESKAYKNRVVEYCMEQDKIGEPVVYKELSYYLDEAEPARFEQFVQERQEQPREELIPDKTQLRKYVRFSGRSKEMSLQFAAELLGNEIEFDPVSETLTLRRLPKPLLQQLKKHRSD
ncbi:MAG TPA: nucleoid-associated protein [Dongiaceae bacterium]|nr:nucleoid-associated protein [Dongiaceae bacterium]